jgi:hypothetical protein
MLQDYSHQHLGSICRWRIDIEEASGRVKTKTQKLILWVKAAAAAADVG